MISTFLFYILHTVSSQPFIFLYRNFYELLAGLHNLCDGLVLPPVEWIKSIWSKQQKFISDIV